MPLQFAFGSCLSDRRDQTQRRLAMSKLHPSSQQRQPGEGGLQPKKPAVTAAAAAIPQLQRFCNYCLFLESI